MDLFSVLLDIQNYAEDCVVYVARPWTLESETRVLPYSAHILKYINTADQTFEYFLEISVIDELCFQFSHQNLCLREQCQNILEYAINTRL